MNRVANHVKAVNGDGVEVCRGKVVGLVGESGSGRITVGRTLLRLEEATAGSVGFDVRSPSKTDVRRGGRRMSIIVQEPYPPTPFGGRHDPRPCQRRDQDADLLASRERSWQRQGGVGGVCP